MSSSMFLVQLREIAAWGLLSCTQYLPFIIISTNNLCHIYNLLAFAKYRRHRIMPQNTFTYLLTFLITTTTKNFARKKYITWARDISKCNNLNIQCHWDTYNTQVKRVNTELTLKIVKPSSKNDASKSTSLELEIWKIYKNINAAK